MTLNCHKACEETRRFRVISIFAPAFFIPLFLDETGEFLYNVSPKGSGAVEQVLTKEYYLGVHETYGCYEGTLPLLLDEVQRLQENAEECELFLNLYRAVGDAENWDGTAVIPEGVTAVLGYAGNSNGGLRSVEIGKNVQVEGMAFYLCENLERVVVGPGVTLGDNAFLWCQNLTDVMLDPEGMGIVEINEALGKETAEVFRARGFCRVDLIKDFSDKDRFVKFAR